MNPRPKKKIPELTSFTVMISRGMGKVRSFSVSSRFLLGASLMLVLYIVGSTVGISLYVRDLWNETIQSDRVKQLADETEETKRTLYQARQRLKLLEDTIYELQGKEKKGVETPTTSVVSPPVPEKPVSQEKNIASDVMDTSPESSLEIRQLETRRSGENLSVKFRLVKTGSDREQLNGYLFIIASSTTADPPRFWTHPGVELKDGVPVDYKRGEAFKVRNYRIIRKRFGIDPPPETPSLLHILAYDASGTLILQTDFSIETAP